jgi:hypothetical protein
VDAIHHVVERFFLSSVKSAISNDGAEKTTHDSGVSTGSGDSGRRMLLTGGGDRS